MTDHRREQSRVRKQRQRQRQQEAGLIRMDVWVRPELRERVKRYVARLMRSDTRGI